MPSSFSSLSLLRRVNAHRAYILHCAISPDVRWLVTCSADKTSRLWDVKELNLMATLTGHKTWVWDAAFSADSAYLLTGMSLEWR
jgi:G protein beta subunit-like protein